MGLILIAFLFLVSSRIIMTKKLLTDWMMDFIGD